MENYEDERYPLNREKISKSNMSAELVNKLNKKYAPGARIDDVFRGKEITFLTNNLGEPITLYIGKRNAQGQISGECFFRRIKKRVEGEIKESHWNNQGKVSGK